jgi:hypothetical protein
MITWRDSKTPLALVPLLLALPVISPTRADGDGTPTKKALGAAQPGPNLLKSEGWRPWGKGFTRANTSFLCDNGEDATAQRGASQTVALAQKNPEPIIATAESRAFGVSGSPDGNYSLYLDLQYNDGTSLWGQSRPFAVGTHDWQGVRVVVLPEKPVKSVTVNLLFRGHAGRVEFRGPTLGTIATPSGGATFDGVPIAIAPGAPPSREGFQVRDVAASGDFVRIDREALGLRLDVTRTPGPAGATLLDVTIADTTGKDRAITLVYAIPQAPKGLAWLNGPGERVAVEANREYVNASQFRVGSSGRLSRYPFAAVSNGANGLALGLVPEAPAFFRAGYHAAAAELYLAFDIGLAPEKPQARFRLVTFPFNAAWGFRSALSTYYDLFPRAFARRVDRQGLWMPFAKISKIPHFEDFGFRIKEGDDEVAWDDAHDVLTFRYTEPMTWWMPMGKGVPRTIDAARAEAERLAGRGQPDALAYRASAYHDASGQTIAELLDRPWNDGAVWSINSMPGITGDVTDFKRKWNPELKRRLYGEGRRGDLDGEYIDSSEGYVTAELDYRRDHLAAAATPLVFDPDSFQPAIFRGLIAFEYAKALATDVHGMNRLMMANATPDRLFWLAPQLDVLGTEADWNPGGRWRPMSVDDLLYRRAICRGKPFCFLMNTNFDALPPARVESYMKRCLAFGMFPGFFSADASSGHYFSRPELFERDRPLFRKYLPLCKAVAEAGWEPITGARAEDPSIVVERFGARYLTVFNPTGSPVTTSLALDGPSRSPFARELVTGKTVPWSDRKARLTLDAEDVAVLDLGGP